MKIVHSNKCVVRTKKNDKNRKEWKYYGKLQLYDEC